MKIKWTKPDLDGGSPITEYRVEVRDTAGSTDTSILPADASEIALPNLEKGKPYTFHVAASNRNGYGPYAVCKLIFIILMFVEFWFKPFQHLNIGK